MTTTESHWSRPEGVDYCAQKSSNGVAWEFSETPRRYWDLATIKEQYVALREAAGSPQLRIVLMTRPEQTDEISEPTIAMVAYQEG